MKSSSLATRALVPILGILFAVPLWATSSTGSGQQAGTAPTAPPDASKTNPPTSRSSLADVTYEQVKPGDSFSEFEQKTFVIGYPANWKASEQGENSFRIAPAAGASQEVIADGVVISIAPRSGSLAEATQDLLDGIEKSNPGLHATDTAHKIRVGSARGFAVNLAGDSPVRKDGQPLPEHDWLVTLPRPEGDMLYLVFIAPERDFPQLHPTFQKILNTVQVK